VLRAERPPVAGEDPRDRSARLAGLARALAILARNSPTVVFKCICSYLAIYSRAKRMTASDRDTRPPQETNMARQLISRSSLVDGSFLERARAIPGLAVRSEKELEASLDETLAARPTDAPVWLFGYGSLMWNPAFCSVDPPH